MVSWVNSTRRSLIFWAAPSSPRQDPRPGDAAPPGQPPAQLLGPGEELHPELLEVLVLPQGGLPRDNAAVSLHFGEKQVPGNEALDHRGPAVKLLHGPVGLQL